VSALAGRELRGALLIYVRSLVGRSIMIRDRELVCFDASSFRLFGGSSDTSEVEWWAHMIV